MNRLLATTCLALLLLVAACGGDAGTPAPDGTVLRVVPVGASGGSDGTPTIQVEIADSDRERQRGLGGRPALAPDHGMLFVYAQRRPRLFWMKDCLISLDIAFLDDDGRIVRLATLPPGVGETSPPSVRSRASVRYVLEAAGGWFERHGVRTGDRVDLRTALDGVVPD